ncbi:hypothetical protein CHARACLAT_028217 [Characodon lateralis]|uniref:Uncharacterized protein n=1 Tax=Characodon lateralis TaxID=208331 RepID=A0ABU7D3M6_9TELE|nr:hypothetical protein [Characodon lateralis]
MDTLLLDGRLPCVTVCLLRIQLFQEMTDSKEEQLRSMAINLLTMLRSASDPAVQGQSSAGAARGQGTGGAAIG